MNIGIYGFGAIGRLVAKVALERGLNIAGVVDIDPNIVGRDVGEIIGIEKLGVVVSKDPTVLANADVVIHATTSFLDRAYPQISSVLSMGIDVVSTCETLAYPWYRYPVLARKLDELAKSRGAAVIGTGINPGFLLDTLTIVLASSVTIVKRIRAIRSVEASKRRESFRRKIGIGLEAKEVEDRLRRGELTGHVGYAESVLLVADALDIQPTRVVEEQKPVIADQDIEIAGIRIAKGCCRGIMGYGAAYLGDREIIRVEFHAYVGAPEFEEITIEGKEYSITWRSSGTPGDLGTAAVLLSIAEKITEYPPGLLTMADIVPFKPRIQPTL